MGGYERATNGVCRKRGPENYKMGGVLAINVFEINTGGEKFHQQKNIF